MHDTVSIDVFLKKVGLELFTLFLEKVCNENFLFSRGKASTVHAVASTILV